MTPGDPRSRIVQRARPRDSVPRPWRGKKSIKPASETIEHLLPPASWPVRARSARTRGWPVRTFLSLGRDDESNVTRYIIYNVITTIVNFLNLRRLAWLQRTRASFRVHSITCPHFAFYMVSESSPFMKKGLSLSFVLQNFFKKRQFLFHSQQDFLAFLSIYESGWTLRRRFCYDSAKIPE